MPEHQILIFPSFCSAIGGAQHVRFSNRFAWIARADGTIKRVPCSSLPPREKWTAFNLEDAAQAASGQ